LFAVHTHPDFFVVQPEEGSRAIKVEQIRDLIGFASRKAQFEGFRVVLVHPAEAMNVNASNALLKCLEEPGGNTLIMLVTHQASQLLPTVRSRCQCVDFPVPDPTLALPWLTSHTGNEAVAGRLLALAGGSPLKAKKLAEGDWQKQRDQTFELWLGCVQKKTSLIEAAEALSKFSAVDVMEWLAGWYVDIARLSLNPAAPLLDEEKRGRLMPLADKGNAKHFFESYDRVMELRAAFMRGANYNPQMAMEGLIAMLRA
jgi:DNA polymerase-3 subunit delta'